MTQRIVIVIASLPVGGAELQIIRTVPRLDRSRSQVEILTLSRSSPLAEELERQGFRIWSPPLVNRITQTGFLVRCLRAFLTLPWLWFWFIRKRPDIVHFILPEAYLLGGLCALVAGQTHMIMSRRSLAHYQKNHPLLTRVEKFLHPRMWRIVANSEAIRRDLVREGAPDDQLVVIRNGVDTDMFCPDPTRRAALRRTLDISPNAFVVIIVANLIPYKGHTDLIDALARARAALPDDWHLLCAGRDDGIGNELSAHAAEAGLAEQIRFLGSRWDIPELLNAADVALSCSHEEGFPNAVLEAMAAGLPVIATRVGGTPEIINDGDTGLLVPPHDSVALSNAIVALSKDPRRRMDIGQAARTEMKRAYGLDVCARAYDDLYALAKTSRKRGRV